MPPSPPNRRSAPPHATPAAASARPHAFGAALAALLDDPRVQWTALGALAVLVIFAQANDTTLRRDPIHYAAIARTLAEQGDWLHVRFAETPYFKKPPLLFWLTAALMKALGPTVFAATFWSRAFGVGCVALTAWLGARLLDRRTGWVAGAVLLTSYIFLRATTTFRMDSALLFGVLIALAGVVRSERRSAPWMFFSGVALAVLAKGPPGLLPLALAPLYAWVSGVRPRAPGRWAVASLLLLLPAAWWAWLYAEYGAEPFRTLAADAARGRAASRLEQFWELYPMGLARTWWPWLPFGVVGAVQLLRSLGTRTPRPQRATAALVLAWLALVLLTSGLKQAQYTRYLVLAMPALALMAALPIAQRMGERGMRRLAGAAFAVTAALALALATLPIHVRSGPREQFPAMREILDHRLAPGAPLLVTTTRTRADGSLRMGSTTRANALFHFGRDVVLEPPESVAVRSALVPVLVARPYFRTVTERVALAPLVRGRRYVLAETTGAAAAGVGDTTALTPSGARPPEAPHPGR